MSVDVGRQLRAVRTAFGLSQRELAKRAGVTNGMISLIEQGRVSPSVGSLQKILGSFPMTMAEFFTRDMEAHDEVVVFNDAYRLETEKMIYSHASRMITSDVPVKINGQAGELLGDSLAVDLKVNRLAMRGHVRGTLASQDTQKPVRIRSEQLVAEMATDTAEFSGAVDVAGDGYAITADRLTIHFQPGAAGQQRLAGALSSKEISRMTTRGRVRIQSGTLTASAEQADYEPASGRGWLGAEDESPPAEVARPGAGTTGGRRPAAQRVRVTLLATPPR